MSRADQDAWALGSQEKAARAWQAGRFADQIVPIEAERLAAMAAAERTAFCAR